MEGDNPRNILGIKAAKKLMETFKIQGAFELHCYLNNLPYNKLYCGCVIYPFLEKVDINTHSVIQESYLDLEGVIVTIKMNKPLAYINLCVDYIENDQLNFVLGVGFLDYLGNLKPKCHNKLISFFVVDFSFSKINNI